MQFIYLFFGVLIVIHLLLWFISQGQRRFKKVQETNSRPHHSKESDGEPYTVTRTNETTAQSGATTPSQTSQPLTEDTEHTDKSHRAALRPGQ